MPFTEEQDAFIIKAYYRSGSLDENGQWVYSLQSCISQFNVQYPEKNVPMNVQYKVFSNHREKLVHRFENKSCICKGKSTGQPSVRTEEVVDDVRQRLQASPNKSIRKLAAQAGLSYGTARLTMIKDLNMHPYKITLVQELLAPDYQKQVEYYLRNKQHGLRNVSIS